MSQFRADMASAAVLVAVLKTIASMSLPINVQGTLLQFLIHKLNCIHCKVIKTNNSISSGTPLREHDGRYGYEAWRRSQSNEWEDNQD